MTSHHLHAEIVTDRIDEVFAFFARPQNLGRITRLAFASSCVVRYGHA